MWTIRVMSFDLISKNVEIYRDAVRGVVKRRGLHDEALLPPGGQGVLVMNDQLMTR